MCNPACLEFAASWLKEEDVRGKNVIEVGACDVNGSIRNIVQRYEPLDYIGVDIVMGPGVDDICSVENLIDRYGQNAFDVVISTELLEHVKNWRNSVSNLKRILKPGGILLITTRSVGFKYHGYPLDFWRYEISDMESIFSDLFIEFLEKDFIAPGVFLKARKLRYFSEKNCKYIKLYSIIKNKRLLNLSSWDLLFTRIYYHPIKFHLIKYLPAKIKRMIKKIFLIYKGRIPRRLRR